ncbi:MAG: alkyl hydroperoxide reductase subunit F [Gammaproteobacteria bacterium]|nr:alkyl hydroperoxide reductase subunit F [Gammaproteobacteria bacterium]
MLSPEILEALRGYADTMPRSVSLVVQTGTHPSRAELLDFLTGFCSVSERLVLEERDTGGALRSPMSFMLEVDGQPAGMSFSGIPGGHEFNSLVLAVLHASGVPVKIDESVRKLIGSVDTSLNFEVFVSLSCHNCPDVVQALNQFAAINAQISTEMIDGGLYPELIEKRNIQGVPSVYLNGEIFANGKIDPAQLVQKLLERFPHLKAAGQAEAPELPTQDVTVIGSGPAGVSAAIYAARKGLAVTVIGDRFGGQLKDTMAIENLISVPGTTGPEVTNALQAHLGEYEVTTREHVRVEKISTGKNKTLQLSSGELIESRTVIIATGAKWRELGVPGERENIGNGVAYCPHCDGPFFKGKDVAVIGGGNSGIEAALDLAGIVNSVTVMEFMPELKADQVLIDQVARRDNIRILKNVATERIVADNGKVTGIDYTERSSGEGTNASFSAVFIQIGLVPNSDFLDGVVELNQYGEVVINERGQTSEPGIFACGDVTTVPFKQIIVAMGEGSKAALSAFDYLLMHTSSSKQAAAA